MFDRNEGPESLPTPTRDEHRMRAAGDFLAAAMGLDARDRQVRLAEMAFDHEQARLELESLRKSGQPGDEPTSH